LDKLWIAVDLDDVILDFAGQLRHAIEVEYDVTLPEFNKWEISELMNPVIGRSWWDWLRARPGIWAAAKPVRGALGSLGRLRLEGHYLEILTSKPDWAELSTWLWIGKWHPPVQRVTIVNLKQERKVDVSDADLLIDDKPQNCIEWAEDGRPALCFTQPYNRDLKLPVGVMRVDNWKAIMSVLEGPYLEWPERVRAQEAGMV